MSKIPEELLIRARWYARELVEQFVNGDCLTRAGALTYTTLFAVVPMMTVAYAMFSVLPEFSGIADRVQVFIFDNFVPARSLLLQEKLTEFSERARQLTAAGFLFLFVTAFMMLVNIEHAFNAIWNVAERRRGLPRFLLYWAVLSLGPPLIAGGLFISLYLFSLPLLAGFDAFGIGIGNAVLRLLPLLLSATGFTLLYYAVPNCHVPFRSALIGGLVTMVLFELAKQVFALVVTNSNFEPIYGTFAAVPLFLAWLYMVWVLVLTGAIFVRTLSLQPEIEPEDPEPLLVKCARVLQLVHDAHLEGHSVMDEDIQREVQMNRAERDRIFQVLEEYRLLRIAADDGWTLGRSLRALTLWDLYQRLPDGLDLARLSRVEGMRNVTEPLMSVVQFGSNHMSMSLDHVFGGSR